MWTCFKSEYSASTDPTIHIHRNRRLEGGSFLSYDGASAEGPAGLEEGYMQNDPEFASAYKSSWACTTPATPPECLVEYVPQSELQLKWHPRKALAEVRRINEEKANFRRIYAKPYGSWRHGRLGSSSRHPSPTSSASLKNRMWNKALSYLLFFVCSHPVH